MYFPQISAFVLLKEISDNLVSYSQWTTLANFAFCPITYNVFTSMETGKVEEEMLFLVIMIMVSGGVILLPTASSLFKTSINLYQNHTQGELLLCNVKYLTMPFAYDIILFIGQVKYGIKRPLELISGFSKMKNKKINAQKPRDFYTTAVIML